MSLVWPTLVFLLVVLAAATAFTTIRVIRLFRTLRRFQESVEWGSTRITQAGWDLERSIDRLPARLGRIEAARRRLGRSVATLSLLAGAASRSRARALRVRAEMPRK